MSADPLTIFLLGMLAGLALAYVAMRFGYIIARHRIGTGNGGASVVYTFKERGAGEVRQAFRDIGAEARRAKEDVDLALAGIEALRREVAK